jgi:hypothetical protein
VRATTKSSRKVVFKWVASVRQARLPGVAVLRPYEDTSATDWAAREI